MDLNEQLSGLDARIAARKAAVDRRFEQAEQAAIRTESAVEPEPPAPATAAPRKNRFLLAVARAKTAPAKGIFDQLPNGSFSRRDIASVAVFAAAVLAALVLLVWFVRKPADAVEFVKKNWPYITMACAYVGVDLSLYVKRFLERFTPGA